MFKVEFDEVIAKAMLKKCRKELCLDISQYKASDKVVAVIGGQPGAGKSSITQLIKNEKFDGNIVILNGDDFKTAYPNYKNMLERDPDATSEIVQPYSNYVVNHLKQELMSKHLNVMVEGTMRTHKVPLDTAEEFAKFGYQAEAHIIAVNHYASRIGCIERFEKDTLASGSGRSVKSSSHDEAYNQIPETLKNLVDSKKFNNITIFSRDGEIIAEAANGDDVVNEYINYRNTISHDLLNEINQSINRTIKLKNHRNAPIDESQELEQLRSALFKDYVLSCYERINPQIVKDARETGFVTVHEDGYMPYHVSIENNPQKLAEALTIATGHKVQLDCAQTSTIKRDL